MKLITHGCRGSSPISSSEMMKYGGNTTCFELVTDEFQIFFDTGSGFQNAILNPNKDILVLFSHFHHDHLQGLAFNKYLLKPETKTFVSSALVNSKELNKIIRRYFSGVFFPLDLFDNLDNVTFSNFSEAQRTMKGGLNLEAIKLNHPGGSYGYSVTTSDKKCVFLCDNEFTTSQADALKNFSKNADIVIWDGMFTEEELKSKAGWGHSSFEQGVEFFSDINCGQIIISHHAPYRTDGELDLIGNSLPNGIQLAKDGQVLKLWMKKIEMKPGKTIFKAGEPADGLYIVGSGEVGIYFPTNKEMAEPDIILKANEILGEMGVIDTAPRMATAKALTDCIVIFVSQKEFEKKLDEGDMIVRGVMAILSSRLRELQKRR